MRFKYRSFLHIRSVNTFEHMHSEDLLLNLTLEYSFETIFTVFEFNTQHLHF